MKEKTLKHAVLVFLLNEEEQSVWLAIKSRHIGQGCRTGYGGGKERGETRIEACIRETKQETGGIQIDPESLSKVAVLFCKNEKEDGTHFVCRVDVYFATKWSGTPKQSVEMLDPRSYSIADLPLDELMKADPYWMPKVFSGEKLRVWVHYSPFQKKFLGPVKIKKQKRFNTEKARH